MRVEFLVATVFLSQRAFAFSSSGVKTRKGPTLLPRAVDEPSYNVPEDDDLPKSKRQRRVRPIRRAGQLSSRAQALEEKYSELEKRQEIALQDPNLLVDIQYADVVSPPTSRALKDRLGVDRMTVVQGRTFPLARNEESLVVRARTGTGKTLAFLVPLVERLLAMDAVQFQPGRQIGALIIAPTRELAAQIADTARDLVYFLPLLSVRAVYGGTSIQGDVRSLENGLPSILVATPGRLLDLVQDERIRGRKFADILKHTSLVVLDEADLLVMGGFGKDVLKIMSHLPRKRQTMLFSATIPKRLQTILPEVCITSEWTQIDCIERQDTKPRITETFLSLDSIELYVPGLLAIVRELEGPKSCDGDANKVMIFFPAVRMVRFFADVIRDSMEDVSVWEIHSQLSQSARRRVAGSFRRATSGFLLTSDVSARGMDYPDVDIVVQYGLPSRRELYLHRLGRTGRAGSLGQSILVLMPFESLSILGKRKRQMEGNKKLSHVIKCMSESEEIKALQMKVREKQQPLHNSAEGFVLAFLAYYAAVHKPQTGVTTSIRNAGEVLAASLGLTGLPEMSGSLDDALN